MKTLGQLVKEYGATTIVYADDGEGSSFGINGKARDYSEDFANIPMRKFKYLLHISDDNIPCLYASDWIVTGKGDNPYRYRIFF